MITEETVVVRYQTPNAPNEWLYQDTTDEGKPVRKFYRDMYLGKNQDPLPECTDEEKVQWEEEHEEVTLIANEGCWLWRDHAEDVKREFYPSVSIPAQDEPLWHECTDMAKVDYEAWWERQHPQPEPEVEQ